MMCKELQTANYLLDPLTKNLDKKSYQRQNEANWNSLDQVTLSFVFINSQNFIRVWFDRSEFFKSYWSRQLQLMWWNSPKIFVNNPQTEKSTTKIFIYSSLTDIMDQEDDETCLLIED